MWTSPTTKREGLRALGPLAVCRRAADSNVETPVHCRRFNPGHTPHHIPALKAANDVDEHPRIGGALVAVHDDGRVLIVLDGGRTVTLWNHDPARLRMLVGRNGGYVWYQQRWSLLGTRSRDGDYLFNVAVVDRDVPRRAAHLIFRQSYDLTPGR